MCEIIKNFDLWDWLQVGSATLVLLLSFISSFFIFRDENKKLTKSGKIIGIIMLSSILTALLSTVLKIKSDKKIQADQTNRSDSLLTSAATIIQRSDSILVDLNESLRMQNNLKNNTNNLLNNYRVDKGLKYQKDLESFNLTFKQITNQASMEGAMMEGMYYKSISAEDSIEALKKMKIYTISIINLLNSQIGNPVLKHNKKHDILWNNYLNEMIEFNNLFSGYGSPTVKEIADKISRKSRRFLLWWQEFEFEGNSSYIPGSGLHFEPDEYLLKEKIESIK